MKNADELQLPPPNPGCCLLKTNMQVTADYLLLPPYRDIRS